MKTSLDFLSKLSFEEQSVIDCKLQDIKRLALYHKKLIEQKKLAFYNRALFYVKLHLIDLFSVMTKHGVQNRVHELLALSGIFLLLENNSNALDSLTERTQDFKSIMGW